MFGRHRRQVSAEDTKVPVDAALEGDIAQVEQAVEAYLENPTDVARQRLLGALQALDAQTDQSDAYGRSVIGSAALGYASKGEVLGETGLDSVVDEVPSAELNAQFALVKAAKDEVRAPGSASFASLRAAASTLVSAKNQNSSGH
jgi:hypothetical protein